MSGARSRSAAGAGKVRPPATTTDGAWSPATRSSPNPASGLGRRPLSRFGEPITDAEDRFDVARTDLPPDVLDVRVDCPLVRLERHAAHCVEELRAREHPARLTGHQGDDLK